MHVFCLYMKKNIIFTLYFLVSLYKILFRFKCQRRKSENKEEISLNLNANSTAKGYAPSSFSLNYSFLF